MGEIGIEAGGWRAGGGRRAGEEEKNGMLPIRRYPKLAHNLVYHPSYHEYDE